MREIRGRAFSSEKRPFGASFATTAPHPTCGFIQVAKAGCSRFRDEPHFSGAHPRPFLPGVFEKWADGRLVVTRTRDGGKSFDVLTKGLPQRHAYDVVYRHALTLDATGDRLAFGSTTGELWVSENQGEQWSNVTYTLPPIYAVRFA